MLIFKCQNSNESLGILYAIKCVGKYLFYNKIYPIEMFAENSPFIKFIRIL